MRENPNPEGRDRGPRAALLAVLVGAGLAAVKIVSGVVGHSYALIADGIESLLDIFSAAVVWGGLKIAALPPDEDHPFGHGKAESMAALLVAVTLLGAAAGLAVQSVREILTPHHAPAPFTLVVLVLVVSIKVVMFRRLSRLGRDLNATSLVADAWHHGSDALTSIAAFLGISLALLGGEGWESLDDWAALFACAVIAFNGVRLLRVAVDEIMDIVAPPDVQRRIREVASSVNGVRDVDKCFVRKSGPHWLVGIHVVVDGQLSVAEGHAIGHGVKHALRTAELGVLDALVHVEPDAPRDERHSRVAPSAGPPREPPLPADPEDQKKRG